MILIIEEDGQIEVVQNVSRVEDASRGSRSLIHVFKRRTDAPTEHEGEIELNRATVRVLPEDRS
jgi:hypothetical protein